MIRRCYLTSSLVIFKKKKRGFFLETLQGFFQLSNVTGNISLDITERTVFGKVRRGRGVTKQIESRMSEPSVQNAKEMPIVKAFTVVTRIEHQANYKSIPYY